MRKIKNLTNCIINVKAWEKDTKKFFLTILVFFVIASIFACFNPSKEAMLGSATEEVEEELRKDEDRSRKEVTVTYNNLYCISYCSFKTQGANPIEEQYLGFAGKIYDAKEGVAQTTGQLVNYTYRMLGCGQGLLYGAKLTIFLTTSSVLCGFILSIFLALGQLSKVKIVSKISSAYIFFFR